MSSAITAMPGFMGPARQRIYSLEKLGTNAVAAVTEVSLAFATVVLVTGSIWARIIWGVWWTWDARLTSMFVCWLLYAGYLMLQRGGEPTQRAKFSAVLSLFAFTDVIIVWKSIDGGAIYIPAGARIRTGGGNMDPAMEAMIYRNLLALVLFATVLVMVRMRQGKCAARLRACASSASR